jgi:hypothetical protein
VDDIAAKQSIPVIQGLLREAYEVDPAADGIADGLVEVCEGWGFAAAVLPRIAKCNASAAQILQENMDTVAKISTHDPLASGVFMKDGFHAVIDAVESTFDCMGVKCSDVRSMVDKKSGLPLWQSCRSKLSKVVSEGGGKETAYWRNIGISLIVVLSILGVLLLVVVLNVCCGGGGGDIDSSGGGKKKKRHRSGSDLCAAPRAEVNDPELSGSLVDDVGGPGSSSHLEVEINNVGE